MKEKDLSIQVAARSSPLSRTQVQEVLNEMREFYPSLSFETSWVNSRGDLDKDTSLRTMEKTDFFTREVDEMILKGECRIAIHSAKDLPDPLPQGISLIALTKGLDPSDSLVFRKGESLDTLPPWAWIATSSIRREEAVRQLRSDLHFKDLRGTIGERLTLLEKGEADGVVVAEAALIRLGLTHYSRLPLPHSSTFNQGRLAILAREGDDQMKQLFFPIDRRLSVLYTGLDLPKDPYVRWFHLPLIRVEPRSSQDPEIKKAYSEISLYTHILFTSKSGVRFFLEGLTTWGYSKESLANKEVITVGKATKEFVENQGIEVKYVAEQESSEGVIALLKTLSLREGYLFWPHSARSRPIITDFLKEQSILYRAAVFYDTHHESPLLLPNLDSFDEIFFTSPSTIDAFLTLYGKIPADKKVRCIGEVTQAHLESTLGFLKY